MQIFNHKIELRKCSTENVVNIYVKLTTSCPMDCPFCIYNKPELHNKYDMYKLLYIISKIPKNIKINKISFTGGEPTLVIDKLINTLSLLRDDYPDIGTVVSTCGYALHELEKHENLIDSISLSRHHYNESNVYKLFNPKHTEPISNEYIKSFASKYPNKLHLSCNLIKNHIDNYLEIFKYLKTYSDLGINEFGFVGLMKANTFCEENMVKIKDIDFSKIPNTIETRTTNNGKYCECKNFLTHFDNGNIVKWYVRHALNPDVCHNLLVYEFNKLRIGFDGPIIFQ